MAARRIADAIAVEVAQGRLPERTREFAELVQRAKGKEYQAMHPAKLTFQSLRVHVNQEFEEIKRGIAGAFEVLRSGGRCALLTWKHSECGIVMDCYRNYEVIQDNAPLLAFLEQHHPNKAVKLRNKRRDVFDMDDVRRPTATEVRENSRSPCAPSRPPAALPCHRENLVQASLPRGPARCPPRPLCLHASSIHLILSWPIPSCPCACLSLSLARSLARSLPVAVLALHYCM